MKSTINRITLVLYLVINTLFVEKYASRITSLHWLIAIVYIFVACAIIWMVYHYIAYCKHPYKWLIAILVCLVVFAVGIQYAIDPLSLNVDRWSALHNFLSGFLNGQYPYGQQTHLGGYGSPFPVWQLLHLPFYALGNVGLSIIVVSVLFFLTYNHFYSAKSTLAVSILLWISPAYWYEVAVRSDLITNIMLSAIIVEWLINNRVKLQDNIAWIGLILGLTLSTRLIAAIPICVIYGYEFLQINWKKKCLLVLLVIAVFSATMLPFVFWEGSTLLFFKYNPFVLQTRQGSWLVLLIFACLAIGITIWMREKMTYRWAITGFLLTSLVAMAFIEKMWKENLWTELFSSTFDITYLTVALPFYIMHIASALVAESSIRVSNS